MTKFIEEFPRYDGNYTINVALYNLRLPHDLKDLAYEYIYSDCSEFFYRNAERQFKEDYGHDIGFEGRNGKHLVLDYVPLDLDSLDRESAADKKYLIEEECRLLKNFLDFRNRLEIAFIDNIRKEGEHAKEEIKARREYENRQQYEQQIAADKAYDAIPEDETLTSGARVLGWIESLSRSQGSYGRLLRELESWTLEKKYGWLNDQGRKHNDITDFVMDFEG